MISAQESYYELQTRSILPTNGNSIMVSSTYKIHSPYKNEFLLEKLEKLIHRKTIKCNYTQRQLLLEFLCFYFLFFLPSHIYHIYKNKFMVFLNLLFHLTIL